MSRTTRKRSDSYASWFDTEAEFLAAKKEAEWASKNIEQLKANAANKPNTPCPIIVYSADWQIVYCANWLHDPRFTRERADQADYRNTDANVRAWAAYMNATAIYKKACRALRKKFYGARTFNEYKRIAMRVSCKDSGREFTPFTAPRWYWQMTLHNPCRRDCTNNTHALMHVPIYEIDDDTAEVDKLCYRYKKQ